MEAWPFAAILPEVALLDRNSRAKNLLDAPAIVA